MFPKFVSYNGLRVHRLGNPLLGLLKKLRGYFNVASCNHVQIANPLTNILMRS